MSSIDQLARDTLDRFMRLHPLDIIDAIADAKAMADKEAIITINAKANQVLKRVVWAALNTELSFHTKSLEYTPPATSLFGGVEHQHTVEEVIGMLLELDTKGSCNGADKSRINAAYSTLDKQDRALIDIVVSRKVQCGAGLAKWRKAWGDEFLPDFPCYLSSAFDEAAIIKNIFYDVDGKRNPHARSEVKSDGQRCMAKIMRDGIKLHSRNGKQYIGLTRLEVELALLEWDKSVYGDEVAIDGELVVLDEDGNIIERSKGNGMIGKALKGTMTKAVSDRVVFVVWDIIPMKEFTGEIPLGDPNKIMWCDRNYELTEVVNGLWDEYEDDGLHDCPVRLQQGTNVKDIGEAMQHYGDMVMAGEEGTILKQIYADWEPCPNKKRPTSQYKFKEVFEADFIITGHYKGKKGGKYENAIGGFNIQSSCGMVVSNCGGGLSDDIRFHSNPDSFIGQIMNGEYNGRSKAEGRETFSLTHPRLSEFRPERTEADSLERIIEQEAAARDLKACMGA
ncbi:nucleic acid-binding, OB-fold protein [Vibrio phage 3.058.O._10N.286.46.B8]|nr:nucleic acid-binding, OB-fold protein [Vibrio phage 2.058.O._10N.286.46.B8]AUS03122.1 nucleic acid-binding, OB-fold protein [Vibrio phage 3.058.O._10N.286.46.B8]